MQEPTSEAEHGSAVRDDGDEVAASREFGNRARIGDDRVAGRGDAGRIGQREVSLGGQGLGRNDLDFAGSWDAMVAKRAFGKFVRQARLLSHP